MAHRLTTDCAKNYCNRTLIVKVIIENVVTCFYWDTVQLVKRIVQRPCLQRTSMLNTFQRSKAVRTASLQRSSVSLELNPIPTDI